MLHRNPEIALAWFTRATYAAHLALDPAGLPLTYDQWERRASRMQKEVERELGVAVQRVELDPDELARWAAEAGRAVDAKARAELAAAILARHSAN